MTAPLVVLAFLVVAWTATVSWSAWRRRRDERAMFARAAAWAVEMSRATGDLGAAMQAAADGIEKLSVAFLAGVPLDEEPPW